VTLDPGRECRHDLIAIGSGLVDVVASVEDSVLDQLGLRKGSMTLADEVLARRMLAVMDAHSATPGGSAANTAWALSCMGAKVAFSSALADDDFGRLFVAEMEKSGVDCRCAIRPEGLGKGTGRSLILVTPDGERTMGTQLGAAQGFGPADLPDELEEAQLLFLEAYVLDGAHNRAAALRAMERARGAGTRVALSLSDAFCVERNLALLRETLEAGIDIVFANEEEAMALARTTTHDDAVRGLRGKAPIMVFTKGAEGALVADRSGVVAVPTDRVSNPVDTTGSGDLFAAGFLFGMLDEAPLEECARRGNLAASTVLSVFGARAEADWSALFD